MTVILELNADIQAGLAAQANAIGVPLEVYLAQILREKLAAVPSQAELATKARAFVEWAHNHAVSLPLSDEALRRENLIRDCQ